MASIRLRFGPRDVRTIDVRDPECPARECFWPSRHLVRSPGAGASGGSRTTDEWECGRREQCGCPPFPRVATAPAYQRVGGVWQER